MSLFSDALPLFKTQFEAAMTDTCTVNESGGTGALNVSTGEYDSAPAATLIYSGKCLARPRGDSDPTFGLELVDLGAYVVIVPATVTNVRKGHTVTLTATGDTELTGADLYVRHVGSDTFNARRILSCDFNRGGSAGP